MDSTRNTTSREEARERIRRELGERLRRRLSSTASAAPTAPTAAPTAAPSSALTAPRTPLIHKALRAEQQERAREARWASFDASSTSPTAPIAESATPTASRRSENGWIQGDGKRWAGQVVLYEGALPPAIRARLQPIKETHFRFRHPSDEQGFLSALSSPPRQTATYQATGKKDVTLTASDGRLLGNIHFLHMDGPNVHRPDTYYMKFYLFNFANPEALRDAKQRILEFAHAFSFAPSSSPSSPSSPTSPPPSRLPPSRLPHQPQPQPQHPPRPSRRRRRLVSQRKGSRRRRHHQARHRL